VGSAVGVRKSAARQVGVSVAEYERHRASGEKWCSACKAWHPVSAFTRDRTRGDGLAARCLASKRGRPRVQPLAQRRAHRRIQMRIARGTMPHPNMLLCLDCGHEWEPGERRHEYDHPRGYEGDAALDVEPVCTTCHADREVARRG
jgi:hypothetical protein